MYRRGLIWRFLAALLLVAILVTGSAALFRAGWAQGYFAGSAAGAAGERASIPTAPFGYPGYSWAFPGPFYGPPFGFFFGPWLCLIGIALFFLLGSFFRFWGRGPWHGGHYDYPGPHKWGSPSMHERMHRHHPPEEKQEKSKGSDAVNQPGEQNTL